MFPSPARFYCNNRSPSNIIAPDNRAPLSLPNMMATKDWCASNNGAHNATKIVSRFKHPIQRRTSTANLGEVEMGVIAGLPKTLAQRVVGGVVVLVSLLWLTFSCYLWFRLYLNHGLLAALAGVFGFFIWNIVPFFFVYVWANSQITHGRRRSWSAGDIETASQRAKDLPLRLERSRRVGRLIGFGIVLISLTAAIANGMINGDSSSGQKVDKHVRQFSQSPTVTVKRNPNVDYLDITSEDFYVYKPKSYTGDTPFGLIVYMSPDDDCQLPNGWADVLEKRHLLLVAPQAVGNGTYESRRNGMGIMSALAMMQEYKVDPARVYVAGLSGGARSADMIAFSQPDLFKGTIQDCGCDFYKRVAHNHTTNWTDSLGKLYGIIGDALPANIASAKTNVRFVFITGSKDFRRGNLIDLYEHGYKPEGFQCKLLDIPGMGHQDCNGETLGKALDFIAEAKQ